MKKSPKKPTQVRKLAKSGPRVPLRVREPIVAEARRAAALARAAGLPYPDCRRAYNVTYTRLWARFLYQTDAEFRAKHRKAVRKWRRALRAA